MASTVITCFPVYGMDIAENDQVSVTLVCLVHNIVYPPDMHGYVHVVIQLSTNVLVLICCVHLKGTYPCSP